MEGLIVEEHPQFGDLVIPVFGGELDDADAFDLLGGVGEDGEVAAAVAEVLGPAEGVGGGGVGDNEEAKIFKE